jgi:nicotinate-nucleotide pyrophosphorylase (carboxylating)
LEKVLPLRPDRILLDNMTPGLLRLAVSMASGVGCYLEASGGVTLDSVREIASTGVNGISSGALTHSAAWADIGLDWRVDEQTGT